MSRLYQSEKLMETVDYSKPLCYTLLGIGNSSKNPDYKVEKI